MNRERKAPKVVSLTGAICSGKTWLVRQLPQSKASHWCISRDWYEKKGILRDGIMDWDKFDRMMPKMPATLLKAYKEASRKRCVLFVVEHSGTGRWMRNTLLHELPPDVLIHLRPASEKVLKNRVAVRGLNMENVRRFNTLLDSHGITQHEALAILRSIIGAHAVKEVVG